MMKQKKHRKIPALAAGTTLLAAMTLMASCSTDYEDKIVYKTTSSNHSSRIFRKTPWLSTSCRRSSPNTS